MDNELRKAILEINERQRVVFERAEEKRAKRQRMMNGTMGFLDDVVVFIGQCIGIFLFLWIPMFIISYLFFK